MVEASRFEPDILRIGKLVINPSGLSALVRLLVAVGQVRLRGHGRAVFPLARLAAFRAELYACCTRRADALLELADALLCAQAIPSVAHLSLEPAHRRGWGSAYAALARGHLDAEQLRDLLARHPLDGGLPIYAVDATCWARCDANCSPQRGLYYPRGTRPANRS